MRLLKHISPGGKGSGIVYVPARHGFVGSSEAASAGPPVDMFFDQEELKVWENCTVQNRWLDVDVSGRHTGEVSR